MKSLKTQILLLLSVRDISQTFPSFCVLVSFLRNGVTKQLLSETKVKPQEALKEQL